MSKESPLASIERHATEMRTVLPHFSYELRLGEPRVAPFGIEYRPVGIWIGVIEPLGPFPDHGDVLDDLFHDQQFWHHQGRISHHPDCTRDHCDHPWMGRLDGGRRQFLIRIEHDGTARLPRAFPVRPRIEKSSWKHIWFDPHVGAWMCPFMASDGTWNPPYTTVADLVPHFAAWLIKWSIVEETRLESFGAEHANDAAYHLRHVAPTDLCWCGNGATYAACHRAKETGDVRRGMQPGGVQGLSA